MLKTLAEDFVPETLAAAALINDWLAEHQPESGTVAVGRLAEALGTADFTVRGETITALAQPHRFYLLRRVQDAATDTIEAIKAKNTQNNIDYDSTMCKTITDVPAGVEER